MLIKKNDFFIPGHPFSFIVDRDFSLSFLFSLFFQCFIAKDCFQLGNDFDKWGMEKYFIFSGEPELWA